MATYTINWACGHTTDKQLYGPHAERDRHIEWAESQGLCPDCYVAHRQTDRDATNASARELNTAAGLPALVGSDKQIAWAETIRNDRLAQWTETVDTWATKWQSDNLTRAIAKLDDTCRASVQAAIAAMRRYMIDRLMSVRAETSAGWWIDHRDTDGGTSMVLATLAEHPDLLAALRNADPVRVDKIAAKCDQLIDAARKQEAEAAKAAKAQAVRTQAREILGEGASIKVWTKGDDKRIFGGDNDWTYYHTGNRYNDPKSFGGSLPRDVQEDALRALCSQICEGWTSLRIRT